MLKKFLVGTFIAAAFMVVGLSQASADCSITTTLKVGSSGTEVQCLQTKVGATADGAFGPMTKAAVMAYQANHALSADGVVGPMTRAVLNATVVGGPVQGACPAGYVAITPAAPLFAACVASTPAQGSCPAGYVAITPAAPTFASCKATTDTTPVVGVLVGGAGDITITNTSTDVEDQVTEGAADTKILGFKVEADGSDVSLSNLKVSLKNLDSGSSTRLDRYTSEVSVWMGSTKVGSAMVSDFSKDGIVYSKNIALTNAIVREGTSNKATFYITVKAVSSIDSIDMDSDNWAILVDSVRFQDATGIVLTTGSSNDVGSLTTGAFDFESLTSSGDVKVTVTKGTSSPTAANIKVSDTSSTKDVLMLEFKVKATGSDVTFDTLNFLALEGTASSMSNVVGELMLKNGSDVLATIDGSDISNIGDANSFDLDDTFTIAAGATETFRIYATINDADNFTISTVVTGNLKVSFVSFSPEDMNGDTIVDTGSANGEIQTFVLNAPIFSLVSKSLTLSQAIDGVASGQEDVFVAKFVFNVTAGDDDIYMPSDTVVGGVNTDFATFSHVAAGTVNSVVVTPDSSTIDDGNTSSYLVASGSSEKFTMSMYVRANDQADKFTVTGFNYALADDITADYAAYTLSVTTGLSDFVTDSVYLAK